MAAGAVLVLLTACAQTARQTDEEAAASGPPPAAPEVLLAASPAVAAADAVRERRAEAAKQQMRSATPSYAPRMAGAAMPMPHDHFVFPPSEDRERYANYDDGGVLRAAEVPVSTFSIDVDTGAYANTRRFLRAGRLPPRDAVRVEELVNYFDYAYAPPRDRRQPFSVHTEIAPTPWNAGTQLLRIGLQGWKPTGPLPPANLVFLVDVSGSMNDADKLPLVKSALKLLTRELDARDRISLVVYAGASGVVLEPTPGNAQAEIAAALERLQAGGSTNGGSGIQLAYAMARKAYIKDGINRVLLATDGDFNVGTTDFEQLKDLVERERKSGIALSTLGFGTGNYNDQLMEQLADVGNGNYSYIDSLEEAQRALVTSRAATLMTIASDVKIQVEFNPAVVAEYRLIGYENRALKREDFNNDQVDAGEIGAGHSVTALYEIALVGGGGERIDALRYDMKKPLAESDEYAHLRLRYKLPGESRSELIERPIGPGQRRASLQQASESFRFAAAVAAFGQTLRGGRYTGDYGYAELLALARGARGDDPQRWRDEFLRLAELASALTPAAAVPAVSQQQGHGGG
jgi:Ca-activated chloride channel family protein